jgi:hypothetical protein
LRGGVVCAPAQVETPSCQSSAPIFILSLLARNSGKPCKDLLHPIGMNTEIGLSNGMSVEAVGKQPKVHSDVCQGISSKRTEHNPGTENATKFNGTFHGPKLPALRTAGNHFGAPELAEFPTQRD